MDSSFDDKKWNQIVASCEHAQFLQSVEWCEFQRAVGREVLENISGPVNKITGVCSAFRHDIPGRQNYWYVPRGPIGEGGQGMIETVLKHAAEDGALFVRIDPGLQDVEFSSRYNRVLARSLQPRHTLVLDLSLGQDALLAAMHAKTRYNIRLAQKHDIEVRKYTTQDHATEDALTQFIDLLSATTVRDEFTMHEVRYYQKLLHGFVGLPGNRAVPQVVLYLAFKGEQAIAGSIVLSFGDTVTYLHGASASAQRELMAPYLVQWQAITDAMAAGYRYYDFWGIAPEGVADHPWAGVTRFKKGFGGAELVYPESYDMILRPWWYQAYQLSQKLRGRG